MANASQLVVGANGKVWVADIGTSAPTDATSALAAGWTDLGYVSEDGATFSEGKDMTDIGAWQSFYPIRYIINSRQVLTLATRLGGHLVSGHVDGVGRVVDRRDDARSVRFAIEAPAPLARYIAHKGSICVDGTSLTVNAVHGARFDLNIVPHTLQETIFAGYAPGSRVNLEVDLVARYLERLLLGERAAEPGAEASGVTMELLARAGFLG